MRKLTGYLVTMLIAQCLTTAAFAQNVTLGGNVKNNATGEGAGAGAVTVKGSGAGTITDDRGNYSIQKQKLPVKRIVA